MTSFHFLIFNSNKTCTPKDMHYGQKRESVVDRTVLASYILCSHFKFYLLDFKRRKDNEQGAHKKGIKTANNNTDVSISFMIKEIQIKKIRYHFPLILAKIKLKKGYLELSRENIGGAEGLVTHLTLRRWKSQAFREKSGIIYQSSKSAQALGPTCRIFLKDRNKHVHLTTQLQGQPLHQCPS